MLLLVVIISRWYVRRHKAANDLWKKEMEFLSKQQFGGVKRFWLVLWGKGVML